MELEEVATGPVAVAEVTESGPLGKGEDEEDVGGAGGV